MPADDAVDAHPRTEAGAGAANDPHRPDRAAAGGRTGDAPELLLRLMHGVQARSPQAFGRLHALTQARLFALILRINRDRAEAEEVLQEVFVKVWQQCGRFDSRHGDVGGWLATIANNTAISSLRRRKCRPQSAGAGSVFDDATEQLPCSRPGPLGDAIRGQARSAVLSGLMRLNAEQRESLQLAFFDELSHSEIATRLGRPLGTVKSTVRRALRAMRAGLHAHRDGAMAGAVFNA